MNYSVPHYEEETQKLNRPRRRFLTAATSVVGTVGIAAMTGPFILSWLPSDKARLAGAPVKFDLGKLEPGQQVTIAWRGKPVFVVRRSSEIIQGLSDDKHLQQLRDPDSEVSTQQPDYAVNAVRSIREEYFVVIGICTHLGCLPTFRPEVAPPDLGSQWIGGYYCPCHGSRFDMAGRVFKNVPAPTNLVVPPYRYISGLIIEIGVDPNKA